MAVVALLLGIFQCWIAFQRVAAVWHRWGTAISFTTAAYSLAVFLQYNSGAEPLNRVAEHIQYTTFIVLIHAGYGFIGEFSIIEKLYRDQRVLEIYEGTSEVQRLVIAGNVIGR